jgi:hypothetical protein
MMMGLPSLPSGGIVGVAVGLGVGDFVEVARISAGVTAVSEGVLLGLIEEQAVTKLIAIVPNSMVLNTL